MAAMAGQVETVRTREGHLLFLFRNNFLSRMVDACGSAEVFQVMPPDLGQIVKLSLHLQSGGGPAAGR